MKKTFLSISFFIIILFSCSTQKGEILENKWTAFQTLEQDGVLGERIDLWRNNRLWFIAESGYLIDGFEKRPGIHPWQGEHIGKWLHASTLAYVETGNKELKKEMDEMVERLLKAQLPDGYLGTYEEDTRFMNAPEAIKTKHTADDIQEEDIMKVKARRNKAIGGWDTWTFRYNIYGLLFYEKYFPNEKIVDACIKMVDLLIDTYGEGKSDLTKYGTRQGISATTLLESIVMLYERTLDKKYLDFAEHVVYMSENNPSLRLMGTMLEKGSVVSPGDGKGYQLMANLLGYLRLYRSTGNEDYLTTFTNGWEDIKKNHLIVTGGPWTRKTPYNGNRECFAHSEVFNPDEMSIEGCCDATWIQMNIHMFELTGEAKYIDEAEITLINSVYGHQSLDGKSWCYYTKPNEKAPKYEDRFHCCASSQPRGMEMYSRNLAGTIDGNLLVNTHGSATVKLSNEFGGGNVRVEGNFPTGNSSKIYIESKSSKKYTLEFRLPANTDLANISVNNENVESSKNERGFYEINRKWAKGDMIKIDMDFKLKYHIQKGEKDKQWVAFTYGPLALSQKIYDYPKNKPFKGVEINANTLDMLEKKEGKDIAFKIKGTDIILIPYFLTSSSDTGGPFTYFEI